MSDIVYLNGEFLPRERAKVSIDDRSFLFGDAVYEVLRAIRGRYFEPERHLARLAAGIRALELPDPAALGMDPMAAAGELLHRNALLGGEASVYIQVSRGAAPRRHAFPPPGTAPTVLVTVTPFAPRVEQRARGVAAILQPDVRWQRCDVKAVNLLPNVLANQRAAVRGAYEAILARGLTITEGTHTNVFAVVDGVIRTHPNGPWILPGITREVVLELAAGEGLAAREHPLDVEDLARATEVFLTGTTTDVMPVTAVDGTAVGAGRPGPVTSRLGELLQARLDAL